MLAHGPKQYRFAFRASLLDLGFDLQEQFFQLFGPSLLVLLMDKGEFAQLLDIAQRMGTGVIQITGPAVMHADALEVRQNPYGIGSRFAAFRMMLIIGQLRGCRHMQPGVNPMTLVWS